MSNSASVTSPNLALDIVEEWLFESRERFNAKVAPADTIPELYQSCVTLAVVIVDQTQGPGEFTRHAQTLQEVLALLTSRGLDLAEGTVRAGTPDAMKLTQFVALSLTLASALAGGRAVEQPFNIPRDEDELRRTFELIAGFLTVLIDQHVTLRSLGSQTAAVVTYRLLAFQQ